MKLYPYKGIIIASGEVTSMTVMNKPLYAQMGTSVTCTGQQQTVLEARVTLYRLLPVVGTLTREDGHVSPARGARYEQRKRGTKETKNTRK